MRGVFLVSIAAFAAVWWWGFLTLPSRVPVHFGLSGEPDRWGSKAEALIVFAIIGAAMAALFAVCAWWAGRARLTSTWVNLPHKDWWAATPERTARAHGMLRQDLYGVGALTMALLVVVEAATVVAAHRSEPALDLPVLVAMGVVVAALVSYCVWLTGWRYRPDQPDEVESDA